ncbi:substrate-binding periplasmic protein [Stutzerimonas nitrititolerans]|uniref:substrate-binding periplasmic protein n=1 Tax=Stutzerimonas nitrititolerans TaxID=2482751 RepID=UPI000718A783|nr:ABC transporter substrate-binding protein [Stutzerimonas nitrititolerans]KRW71071.1 amino acid ABC transporter substrate-binding protein [Pseudomonas sp. TTU2014-066ASC]MBA1233936.1 ABC transporter substrate-binding protein [Stutzerimonas stutzeri]HAQ74589.1 amino acid ABC transporter substrate-binding protein [Pseudomonas sp.]MBT1119796.1 ABC transporter substrate-binding protein [Stutzerimonas nitrititolerans]SUD86060.1 ABC-type amino acid transporter [Stutzerimonas stutzeri]
MSTHNKCIRSAFLGALMALLPFAPANAAEETINLLTQNFPPFSMAVDGKNFAREDAISGIDAEVVAALFKRAGVPYAMTLRFPWSRLQQLAEKTPGFAVFSLSRTPEREPRYKWVGPLSEIQIVLLKTPGSPIQVSSLDDARQYRIGSKDGSVGSQYLINRGIEVQSSLIDTPAKLKAGQFDLWATTNPSGEYEAKQAGVGPLAVALTLSRVDLYLAMNKETPDAVVEKLQRTLDQMKQEGLLQQAARRYVN